MLSKNTGTTEALSVSTVLPEGCTAYRQGLVLKPGLSYDEWKGVGKTISRMAGSVMWLLGDWLAYGQAAYHGLEGFKRMENDRYAMVAEDTGFSEQRLRNAKWVCSAVDLSRRRDKLTMSHAEEIVGRSAPGQFDYWIDRVVKEGIPAKKLREMLRKSKSIHKIEPNDSGVTSPLAVTDQYVRDMLSVIPKLTADQKKEHLRNLMPVIRGLSA